jgi:diguanylate cyclase (GGDEF)-like protein/PAS domain S-box-containing protein
MSDTQKNILMTLASSQGGFLHSVQEAFTGWRGWVAPLLLSLLLLLVSEYNFLLFHTLSELFAIMVAILVAVVAWHTYGFSRNHYLMLLGAGYFWIGIIDLLHTFTFKGMQLFPGATVDTGIQFWIVARFFEAMLLLIAPFFLAQRINKVSAISFFGIGTIFAVIVIFKGHFPVTYIDGTGLTAFKVVSEYVIIALLLLSVIILSYRRALIERRVFALIVLSVVLTVAAELCFTLYISVYSAALIAGHLFKLFSFWLIFLAVVKTTLSEPFEIMARTSGSYDAVPMPTVVVNRQGTIQQVNRSACQAAYASPENVLEHDVHELFHSHHVDKDNCVVCEHIRTGKALHEYEVLNHDNCWYEYTLSPFSGEETDLIVHVSNNISDRKHAENALMRQASYDQLTNLPNRVLAMDRLQQAIRHAKRENRFAALMFIDIDNFKAINDTLGHAVGDELLTGLSKILEQPVRSGDTVARWGGDEFLIILDDLHDPIDAGHIAEKVLHSLTQPIQIGAREFRVTASIGIASYPSDGDEVAELLSNADAAMYRAKDSGRNTYHFYTSDISRQASERLEMEEQLRKAVDNEELSLTYQPQIDLRSNKVVGAEALARWNNQKFGKVSPDRFITLAEEAGFIYDIGEWILYMACRDLANWNNGDYPDMRMSINISSLQLKHSRFLETLNGAIDRHGVNPEHLELEMTESILLEGSQEVRELLNKIRDLGIGLSLDDFGTGYSSLSYLKKFPFTQIKIDRQFVRDVPGDSNDVALCRAMISMADSLNLSVVGEGVETVEQLR